MYRCQLNFGMFCGTRALGISWQHFKQLNLLWRSVYRFLVCFHVRIILHHFGISLPHEYGFSKVKNSYIKSAYYSICDDCGVSGDEIWVHADWFYTKLWYFWWWKKDYKRSSPDNLAWWINTQSKGFTRKGIERRSGIRLFSSYVSGPGKIEYIT